ncbi:hypothetical protein CC2G_004597 [Coprinopsis cinerea AmutBmut pab1-1]|nr:hypothetical protein CC2G_004597 [Coprinopsis cinerea AmutBmut pab1-1]
MFTCEGMGAQNSKAGKYLFGLMRTQFYPFIPGILFATGCICRHRYQMLIICYFFFHSIFDGNNAYGYEVASPWVEFGSERRRVEEATPLFYDEREIELVHLLI